jgi:hypothetical protein
LNEPTDAQQGLAILSRHRNQPVRWYQHLPAFRFRDDGCVESEFEHGTEKFLPFEDFEKAVKVCFKQISDGND